MMRAPILSPLMLPCTPPPWGLLTAVSLDTGAILWQTPFGTVPDLHPDSDSVGAPGCRTSAGRC